MNIDAASIVKRLLAEHGNQPGFPFADWATEPASFNRTRAFFAALFEAGAGQEAPEYADVLPPEMNIHMAPFDVVRHDRRRRVDLYPALQGGHFHIITKQATDDYRPDWVHLGEMPARSWFSIGIDFNPLRLAAALDMIHSYIHAEFVDLAHEEIISNHFIAKYDRLFDE